MKKIKWGLAVVAAVMATTSVQASIFKGLSGTDKKFSTVGNWDVFPTNGAAINSISNTTATSMAQVDSGFTVQIANANLYSSKVSSTSYVEIVTGGVFKQSSISIGNAINAAYSGSLTVRTGGTLTNAYGNSGALAIGGTNRLNSGAGFMTIEAGAAVQQTVLTLGQSGTLTFQFDANSVSTLNLSKTTAGTTNTLNGLLQVDLGAYTGSAGTYTLINGVSNTLGGALYTTLSGGSISGTGTYSSANFAVLNGGAQQWTLGLADSGKDVVLTLIPEPATLGLFAGAGAFIILLRRRMTR